jgi:drug/metabolite transporter (DMT)-like permease
MLPLVLALAASAAWGSADFLGGRASRSVSALHVALFSKVAGASGLAVACVVAAGVPSGEEAAWAFGSGLFGAGALVALYRALALGPMSLVAPLTACGGAVPVIVALALGDVPGPLTGAGLAIAFAGAVVVSRPANPEAPTPGMQRVALAPALAAALGIGLALTMLQQAAQAPGDATLGLSLVAALTSIAVLASIAVLRGGAAPRIVLAPLVAGAPRIVVTPLALTIAGCGLLDVTANVLLAEASADGNAAVVAVLGSLYPLATVLLARAWLGERLSAVQGAGVVAAMSGVVAIAAGS